MTFIITEYCQKFHYIGISVNLNMGWIYKYKLKYGRTFIETRAMSDIYLHLISVYGISPQSLFYLYLSKYNKQPMLEYINSVTNYKYCPISFGIFLSQRINYYVC